MESSKLIITKCDEVNEEDKSNSRKRRRSFEIATTTKIKL